MKGLQVVEVDVYPFENRHDRRVLMSKMKLKNNEVTIHKKLIIVTRERILKDEKF